MTKQALQDEAVKLALSYKNLLLSWCTGCGKTFGFIQAQEALKSKKTLIVVAEIAHIQGWRDEYYKHRKEYLLKSTTIICYASLHKQVHESYDLICLDEAHRITDTRADYLRTIEVSNVIALTATIGWDNLDILEGIWGRFYEFKVTLEQAIEWGIIPKPAIHLIPMKLDDLERTEIVWFSRGKRTQLGICQYPARWGYLTNKKKYPNLHLEIRCTPLEKYEYLSSQMNYLSRRYQNSMSEFDRIQWLRAGSDRKRFLTSLKTNMAHKYVSDLFEQKKRFICFCGSIDQANILGGKNVLHSKTDDPQRVIDNFNSKKINSLFVVNMLQEGANLVDIDAGVIIQLDSIERSFIQKTGRTLRSKYHPEVYILYFENTRDEEYVRNSIQDINPEYINKLPYDNPN